MASTLADIPFGGHPSPIVAVAVTPDGTEIITAGTDGTASIWDRRSGQHLRTPTGHFGPIWAVSHDS
ncbi:MAG: WD40 repeat domain-containing protein [Egibacteraceae bacterium]